MDNDPADISSNHPTEEHIQRKVREEGRRERGRGKDRNGEKRKI